MAKLKNIHAGEILLEEFLMPMAISQNRLARDIGVPPQRINEIVHGKRAVMADTALRLARYFGISEAFMLRGHRGKQLFDAPPLLRLPQFLHHQ